MTEYCEDCPETRKLSWEIKGLDISLQKQKVLIEGYKQESINQDIEHEAMMGNISNRMDSMSEEMQHLKKEFSQLKTDVRTDINSVKEDIPKLFETSINKLMARIAKYFIWGIVIAVATLVLAWTRPYIICFLKEVTQKVETYETRIQ